MPSPAANHVVAPDNRGAGRSPLETLQSPLAQGPDGSFAQAQACIDWDGAAERLRDVSVPTLVIVGAADIVCPPPVSQLILEAMPHAELAVIEGGAHQPFQERPDEYNAIVAGFWTRVGRRERIGAAA